MCTICSFSPFLALEWLSFHTIEPPRDQSIWDRASLLMDCSRGPFDPVVDEVAWHWCENAPVFLLIGQYWHQIIPLVPTVFFGGGDCIHLGLKLLQSVNVTI